MEFTDEEKIWLQSIVEEIPEESELTPVEKQLWEKAKPDTECQGQFFQVMASIRFGLNDSTISTKVMKNPLQQRISVICG
ncbi:hypothetical protein IRJ41_009944 [Triplophysa rosa]|uniref:Uncharacterized protein n=1 Tax=Triplophysa rosa TaxID=992332 RepID=A0A9W8CAX9_TRIRA|nr:hypothetical protein IRJ41_009944 [Triplophysa rosa]